MAKLTLGNNTEALKANGKLSKTTNDLSKAFERLSSGLRINRASDDPAGMAIAASLQANKQVFLQGVRNLNDGISLISIADNAIDHLTSIVFRIKELASQSANGVTSAAGRKALDTEAQALSQEYTRIIQTTQFNGRSVLGASFGQIRLQAGTGTNGSISSGLGGTVGTGQFGSATSFSASTTDLSNVVAADINGDGILDMVTSGVSGGNSVVGVRLGTGGGGFGGLTSYTTISAGGLANGLAVGDIDGDGNVDIVTAIAGTTAVLSGLGNGSFSTAVTFGNDADNNLYSLRLEDVDTDGVLDLLISGYIATFSQGGVTVQHGFGNGTFASTVTGVLYTGTDAQEFSAVDINGDGKKDIVAVTNGGLEVALGNGNGTYGSVMTHSLGTITPTGMDVGDINGDGKIDVIASGIDAGTGRAIVFLGNGNGSFTSSTTYTTETSGSYDADLGDMNGDGYLDLITSGTSGGAGSVSIRLNQGNGTFGNQVSYATAGTGSLELTAADVNQDGVLDILDVTSGTSTVEVRLASTTEGTSTLLPFDLTIASRAREALSFMDQKLNQLTLQRGTIGSFQSRVEIASRTLQVISDHYGEAASKITDADVAEEIARMVRLQVLQSAGTAIAAQANQSSEIVLELLS